MENKKFVCVTETQSRLTVHKLTADDARAYCESFGHKVVEVIEDYSHLVGEYAQVGEHDGEVVAVEDGMVIINYYDDNDHLNSHSMTINQFIR